MKHSYYTKLAGVSFRQDAVAKLVPGKTPLRAVAEPENEYDQYAVRVEALLKDGWELIGYIAKGSNREMHCFLVDGGIVNIACKDVTGEDKKTLGVNVSVEYGEDDSVDISTLMKQRVDFGDTEFVYFDELSHKTFDPDGRELQSGSATESKYARSVDLSYAAKAIAKKTGLLVDDITSVWDAKAELSRVYGTLLHKAVEFRLQYSDVMNELDEFKKRDNSAVNWMPEFIGVAIDKLMKKLRDNGFGAYEQQYSEARLKFGNLTGIADLILMHPDGEFRLIDFKTNHAIKNVKYEFGSKKEYTVQQNHYRTIMESLGYRCNGMELYHYDGTDWEVIPLDRVGLTQEILWTK